MEKQKKKKKPNIGRYRQLTAVIAPFLTLNFDTMAG